MESNVQLGEAAILRGAVATVQVAHGEAPGLQVQAAPQADVHRRREEDANLRVQVADATASPGDAPAVVPRRRPRDGLPVASELGPEHAPLGRRALGEAVGVAATLDAQRRRPQLRPPLVLLPPGQSVALGRHELLPRQLGLDGRL